MELIEKINSLKDNNEIEKFYKENKTLNVAFCIYHNIKNVNFVFYILKNTIETIKNHNINIHLTDFHINDILLNFDFNNKQYLYILDSYSDKVEFITKDYLKLFEKFIKYEDVLLKYIKITNLFTCDKFDSIKIYKFLIEHNNISIDELIIENVDKFSPVLDTKYMIYLYKNNKTLCDKYVFDKLDRNIYFYEYISFTFRYINFDMLTKHYSNEETSDEFLICFINEILLNEKFIEDKIEKIKLKYVDLEKHNIVNFSRDMFQINFNYNNNKNGYYGLKDIYELNYVVNKYYDKITKVNFTIAFDVMYEFINDKALINCLDRNFYTIVFNILNKLKKLNNLIDLKDVKFDKTFMKIMENVKDVKFSGFSYFVYNNRKNITKDNINIFKNIFNEKLDDSDKVIYTKVIKYVISCIYNIGEIDELKEIKEIYENKENNELDKNVIIVKANQ